MVNGQSFTIEAEALQALTSDFARKIDRLVPLWVHADLVEAPN